jgi:hypothetical protein
MDIFAGHRSPISPRPPGQVGNVPLTLWAGLSPVYTPRITLWVENATLLVPRNRVMSLYGMLGQLWNT